MSGKKLTRREFLAALATAVGGGVLIEAGRRVSAQTDLRKAFFPVVSNEAKLDPTNTPTVTNTPIPTATKTPKPSATPTKTTTPVGPPPSVGEPRVAHVRAANATNWNGTNSQSYYRQVNQEVVDTMFAQALLNLTGAANASAAWNTLFGRINKNGYEAGQKIAVKINLNYALYGSNNCTLMSNEYINATPQPVIAMLKSMKNAVPGVKFSDIYLYDATGSPNQGGPYGRPIYEYYRTQISSACQGVNFVGYFDKNNGCADIIQSTYGKDTSLVVKFHSPKSNGLLDRKLVDILYDASYLINMPLLKGHGSPSESGSSTLAFSGALKNHYGSINYVYASGDDNLHSYTNLFDSHYSASYSPMVEIYKNANVAYKTILNVTDGLFGSTWGHTTVNTWSYFNGPANSLLLSIDPVALDTVLGDIVSVERGFSGDRNMGFLKLAENAGLGKTESNPNSLRDPRNSNAYSVVKYSFQALP